MRVRLPPGLLKFIATKEEMMIELGGWIMLLVIIVIAWQLVFGVRTYLRRRELTKAIETERARFPKLSFPSDKKKAAPTKDIVRALNRLKSACNTFCLFSIEGKINNLTCSAESLFSCRDDERAVLIVTPLSESRIRVSLSLWNNEGSVECEELDYISFESNNLESALDCLKKALDALDLDFDRNNDEEF